MSGDKISSMSLRNSIWYINVSKTRERTGVVVNGPETKYSEAKWGDSPAYSRRKFTPLTKCKRKLGERIQWIEQRHYVV